ncbi:MAG: GNAT family N-acetyltransferase [Candidatus Binataceae bacterium]
MAPEPEFDAARVHFRTLAHDDLRRMHRWINDDPEVRQWWSREAGPLEKIVAKYAPRIGAPGPTRSYIIQYDTNPIGYIQEYLISEHRDWQRIVGVAEVCAGVDLFVGEAAYRGRGRGAAILRKFVREVVFARPEVESCIIGPDENNARAIRSYEKAGFRPLKRIYDPDSNEHDLLLRIWRDEAPGGARHALRRTS